MGRATVKAGTQERGTECRTERGMEIKCKVRHNERGCAHCEGTHGDRRDHQVYSLAVQFTGSGQQPSLFVSLSV